jgi:hypothetical protein
MIFMMKWDNNISYKLLKKPSIHVNLNLNIITNKDVLYAVEIYYMYIAISNE